MGSTRAATFAAAFGLASAWACGTTSAFVCEHDGECSGTGAPGVCEPSGYCSFPDGECPSGRRYGARAPTELAEACVDPSDVTSVGVTDDGDDVHGDTTTDDTTGTASATSLTTTPVDPTSDGDTGVTTNDASASSSSEAGDESETGTTGMPEPDPCRPVFVDAFDDPALGPEWSTWTDAGCSVALADGHLELSVGPSANEWISAGAYTDVHSFAGGQVRAELVPYEPPIDVVGVWLTIFDDANDCEVQIVVEAGQITSVAAAASFEGPLVATDAPLWLQLRIDAEDVVHWEYSTDGADWTEAHSQPSPCDFTSARSALFAGGVNDQQAPIVRAVESFERCEAP